MIETNKETLLDILKERQISVNVEKPLLNLGSEKNDLNINNGTNFLKDLNEFLKTANDFLTSDVGKMIFKIPSSENNKKNEDKLIELMTAKEEPKKEIEFKEEKKENIKESKKSFGSEEVYLFLENFLEEILKQNDKITIQEITEILKKNKDEFIKKLNEVLNGN